MGRDGKFYGALLCFVMGLSLLLYPSLANWVNGRHSSRVISSYSNGLESLSDEDCLLEWDAAQKHNDLLALQGFLAAGVDLEVRDHFEMYNGLLNVGKDGVMGVVRIPKVGVNLPVYHSCSESVLQRAVGHYPGSSLPVGGSSSHCILSGHRGLPSAELFTHLDALDEGDLFFVDVLDQTLAYKVDKIVTIDPDSKEGMALLNVVEGQDLMTLLTCTPYGVNTHRLLVRGHRVKYVEEQEFEEVKKGRSWSSFRLIFRVVILLIAIFVAVWIGLFLARFRLG